MSNELLRLIPKMDVLLERIGLEFEESIDVSYMKALIDEKLCNLRKEVLSGAKTSFDLNLLIEDIKEAIRRCIEPSMKRVINATGIVLHTNLGRAVIAPETLSAITPALCGYNTLEYDVQTGRRGSRYAHIEEKIRRLTGAEAALVVNNNAAAVMLVLNTLAHQKEVIVSRGELVEIGGAFRVPDVMSASGCVLKEVGTTNKTHLYDYEKAVNSETALLMKVHTSNYKIVGFTESVEAETLCDLGRRLMVPVYEDLGSGLMLKNPSLPWLNEPTVCEKIQAGIDVITFSGDKLFGGAQCGIIVGKKALIEPMKKNPLLRAFRMDKMTLAVLEQLLIQYFNPQKAFENILTLKQLSEPLEATKEKTKQFIDLYGEDLSQMGVTFDTATMASEVGGGAVPLEKIPSFGIVISGIDRLNHVQDQLRRLKIPIVCVASNDCLMFDFKTIFESDFQALMSGLSCVLGGDNHA